MTQPRMAIQESLERRIVHGLACEWQNGLWVLPAAIREQMRKPFFGLSDMRRLLGYWSGRRREIVLSRHLVLNSPWDCVVEVLRHEMAHQLTEEVLGSAEEPAHGPAFQKACRLLRANPNASGRYPSLRERVAGKRRTPQDRVLVRVKKLMALAESANRYEAEAAMVKAHALIAKYNINLLARNEGRDFVSLFVGRPALRHFREAYDLANLLGDFYFIAGLWVPAYVMEKRKMGRVFEMTGTASNVETASYVHDFVDRYIRIRWQDYNTGGKLNRYRQTDFAVGVIEGFWGKLMDERRRRQPASDDPRAIVEIEDPLLSAHMKYRYPRTTCFKRQAAGQDPGVYEVGQRVGREMIISRGITEKNEGAPLKIGLEK